MTTLSPEDLHKVTGGLVERLITPAIAVGLFLVTCATGRYVNPRRQG